MAKAKQLPSGNWRVQVYDYTDSIGKRHYKSFTAETKKEANFLSPSINSIRKKNQKQIILNWAQLLTNI